jgi:rhodanese-related sulfurtransferase
MKKIFALALLLVSAFALTACGEEETTDPVGLPALPDVVDMTNIDEHLDREDVQYVDLRNFEDKMKSGYIAGFEFIPFFDYMEFSDVLVRTDGNWEFDADDINNEAALRGLFDEDKTIFLMCGSGTRAGFVKAALESLGYENVYNVGGIGTYEGTNKVLGDGSFTLKHPAQGDYTPGTYYGEDGGYSVVITVGAGGAIESVYLDAVHKDRTTGAFLGLKKGYEIADYPMNYTEVDGTLTLDEGKLDWFMQAEALELAIVENQGWVWTLVEGDFDTDGVAGVSIGVENWMNAVTEALNEAQ